MSSRDDVESQCFLSDCIYICSHNHCKKLVLIRSLELGYRTCMGGGSYGLFIPRSGRNQVWKINETMRNMLRTYCSRGTAGGKCPGPCPDLGALHPSIFTHPKCMVPKYLKLTLQIALNGPKTWHLDHSWLYLS